MAVSQMTRTEIDTAYFCSSILSLCFGCSEMTDLSVEDKF